MAKTEICDDTDRQLLTYVVYCLWNKNECEVLYSLVIIPTSIYQTINKHDMYVPLYPAKPRQKLTTYQY